MNLTSFLWNKKTRNLILRILPHLPIVKGRVICICWGGAKYNCNPRAITDTMIEKDLVSKDKSRQFEINYAFVDPSIYEKELPNEIGSVEIGSLKYFYILATSQFILSNTRFARWYYWPFKKRKGQYYIQTMHGGHGIKKIEWDAADTLDQAYLFYAEQDRVATDLMLSNSKYWTRI